MSDEFESSYLRNLNGSLYEQLTAAEARIAKLRSTVDEQVTTISAAQKRIAELYAGDADRQHYLFHLEGSYASERQRREEAEAVARPFQYPQSIEELVKSCKAVCAYFSKYEPAK